METATETNTQTKAKAPAEARLRSLGLTAAADGVKADRELARKMRVAFEFYRVVTPDNIARFNEKLKTKTRKDEGTNAWGMVHNYDTLKLTPLESYGQVPPDDVLDKLQEAKERNCFDRFEVATIASQRVVPDPILFGVINGCADRYCVAQWDDDVKLSDILAEDEG